MRFVRLNALACCAAWLCAALICSCLLSQVGTAQVTTFKLAADLEELPRRQQQFHLRGQVVGGLLGAGSGRQSAAVLLVRDKGLALTEVPSTKTRWTVALGDNEIVDVHAVGAALAIATRDRVFVADMATGKFVWHSPPHQVAALWRVNLLTCDMQRVAGGCKMLKIQDRTQVWQGQLDWQPGLRQWVGSAAVDRERPQLLLAETASERRYLYVDGRTETTAASVPLQATPSWFSTQGGRLGRRGVKPGAWQVVRGLAGVGACALHGGNVVATTHEGLAVVRPAALVFDEVRGDIGHPCGPATTDEHGAAYLAEEISGTALLWQVKGDSATATLLGDLTAPSDGSVIIFRSSEERVASRPIPLLGVVNQSLLIQTGGGLAGVATAATDQPRRAHFSLRGDIETWLDMATGKTPRSASGECIDVPWSAEASLARLLRLPRQAWATNLLGRISGAQSSELVRLAALACGPHGADGPVVAAWRNRWLELFRTATSAEFAANMQAIDPCPAAGKVADAAGPMLDRLARQPWTEEWNKARAQVAATPSVVPTDAQAAQWAAGLGKLGPGADRHLWHASMPLLAHWQGLPGFLAATDAQLRAAGPAAVCPRLRGDQQSRPCMVEPDARSNTSAGGWAILTVSDGLGFGITDALWAMHWQGDNWAGPYFVTRELRLPPLQALTDGKGLGQNWSSQDTGSAFAWQDTVGPRECDPDVARLRAALRPAPIPWLTVTADADRDGWTDHLEGMLGTNPKLADTDGDGRADSRDPAPLCTHAQPESWSPQQAVLAAWLRLRANPQPLAIGTETACVDAPTRGGVLLPVSAERPVADLAVRPLADLDMPGCWQVDVRQSTESEAPETWCVKRAGSIWLAAAKTGGAR